MLTTMADVKRFLQRHNGSLMYCTDWSKDSCPQIHTTVYTGTDLWKLFAKQVTISADRIVNEALDHPTSGKSSCFYLFLGCFYHC